MKRETELVEGRDIFTLRDLLRKTLTHKGLRLWEEAKEAYSQHFAEYELDERLLGALSERGIRRQDRSDCGDRIFTLVDGNPQEKVPGWSPSNYWNFKRLEDDKGSFDLRVSLMVGLHIDHGRRGIVFVPRASGTFVSPSDSLPNFRMFKVLVENDEHALPVAKELARSDGTITVTWTDLGLGGIRSIWALFTEFASGRENVLKLGRSGGVFDPIPYLRHQQPGDELFVVEQAQPEVFEMWRTQLGDYRSSLTA